jgi:GNAT superfamily N-acetyltransferase
MTPPLPPPIVVAPLEHSKEEVAEAILRDLPDWFGIEEATLGYIAKAGRLPMLVARAEGQTVGFVCLEQATPAAIDVHVIGVLRAWHRQGVGHALIDAAAASARAQGAALLTVKTLSSRHPDPGYAATRRFYEAEGFLPVAELPEHWGPDNPCLLMARVLTP